MKTPEEMAEEYTRDWWGNLPEAEGMRKSARENFLAGYQAAKDQLADGGKVTCNTTMEEVKAVDTGELMPITILPTSAKWISVKERLPENDQDVLVCVNGQVLVSYVHGMKGFSNEWALAENGETIWPTHWMPLPEPPKEDK